MKFFDEHGNEQEAVSKEQYEQDLKQKEQEKDEEIGKVKQEKESVEENLQKLQEQEQQAKQEVDNADDDMPEGQKQRLKKKQEEAEEERKKVEQERDQLKERIDNLEKENKEKIDNLENKLESLTAKDREQIINNYTGNDDELKQKMLTEMESFSDSLSTDQKAQKAYNLVAGVDTTNPAGASSPAGPGGKVDAGGSSGDSVSDETKSMGKDIYGLSDADYERYGKSQ